MGQKKKGKKKINCNCSTRGLTITMASSFSRLIKRRITITPATMNQNWEITRWEDVWFIPPIWIPRSPEEEGRVLYGAWKNILLITAKKKNPIRCLFCSSRKFAAHLFDLRPSSVMPHSNPFSYTDSLWHPSFSREHFSPQAFYCCFLPH